MEFRKVVAIIRTDRLAEVEKELAELGVSGLSTTRVKGYGEYANFFSRDPKVLHARVEVVAERDRAYEIVRTVLSAASTGQPGDGLVMMVPVEHVWRIRTCKEATAEDLL
ncbi:MAG TPA: P-II family nitrogen regulator [Acidobacteriota bacterium]|nr:P-II family nitrogen regulator [Acidobacteriota bacterium]